jgi:hypothetical protein
MIRVYQEEHRNLKSLKGKGNKKTSKSQTRVFQEVVTKKKKERKLFDVSAWKCRQICTLFLKTRELPVSEQNFISVHRNKRTVAKRSLDLISTKWLQGRHDRKEAETLRCLKCKAKEWSAKK